MFDFMADEAVAVMEPELIVVESQLPQPRCIHHCTTPNPERGYLMSQRTQTYICKRCMASFDREVAHDREKRDRLSREYPDVGTR